MKKVIALLLSILLAFSCAACAGGNISDQSSGSSDTPATETPAQTSGENQTEPPSGVCRLAPEKHDLGHYLQGRRSNGRKLPVISAILV